MKLEGGEWLVLKTLRDLQGDSTDYVDDVRLAAATKMSLRTCGTGWRRWRARASLSDPWDRWFQRLRQCQGQAGSQVTEPISIPKPARDGAPVTASAPGGTGAAPPQPATAEEIITDGGRP